MIAPQTPPNEAARLQSLHAMGILDTEAEERFDRLTRIANRLFDVPIALVSLVDENRQWFKSCVGLDVPETTRDISFCGHAILRDELMVVEDATADVRFQDNPLVTGMPHVRFYAGCPLDAGEGLHVGTLCLIDTKPRRFSAADRKMLADLGAMVQQELRALALANTDELTQLTNRRGFFALGKQVMELCNRLHKPVSLIFFDLDGFKGINDRFGHTEGDAALKAFAKLLQGSFRASDVVARLGGDEFAVMLSGTPQVDLPTTLRRFYETLHSHNRQAALGYDLACSAGTVQLNSEMNFTFEALVDAADRQMYLEKKYKSA
ncbi:MAG: sensor domain-containing diguanylate cyclase [Lacisediminimonas sp.]|nr:sensor domain-containing diguanylate cyclase [Lacisediminimonas sp.]